MEKDPLLIKINHLIPKDHMDILLRADDFIKEFEENGIPAGSEKLLKLLDLTHDLLDALREAAQISAFLVRVDFDSRATNDNDIMDNADHLEAGMSYFENLSMGIQDVQERLVRILSRSTFT